MKTPFSYTLSREYRVLRNRYSWLILVSEDRLCANLRVQEQSAYKTSQCSYLAFVLRHRSTVVTFKCSVRKGRPWRQCRNEQPMIVSTEFCVQDITEYGPQMTMDILVSKRYGRIASKWKNCTKRDSSAWFWFNWWVLALRFRYIIYSYTDVPIGWTILIFIRQLFAWNCVVKREKVDNLIAWWNWFPTGLTCIYFYICSSFSEVTVLSKVWHSTGETTAKICYAFMNPYIFPAICICPLSIYRKHLWS